MNYEYEEDYYKKKDYLLDHIEGVASLIGNQSCDYVDMAYDYLDTIDAITLMGMPKSEVLRGYKKYVKQNWLRYLINDYGERI